MIERWASRILEGKYLWGDFRVGTPSRTGWSVYRLTLYPPGTNGPERRILQFWYSWPVVGALLSLLSFVLLGDLLPPLALVALTMAGYSGGVIVGWRLSRQLRSRVRLLNVAQFPADGAIRTLGDVETLSHIVEQLSALDAQRRAGLLTAIEYEQGWSRAYDQIGRGWGRGPARSARDESVSEHPSGTRPAPNSRCRSR